MRQCAARDAADRLRHGEPIRASECATTAYVAGIGEWATRRANGAMLRPRPQFSELGLAQAFARTKSVHVPATRVGVSRRHLPRSCLRRPMPEFAAQDRRSAVPAA